MNDLINQELELSRRINGMVDELARCGRELAQAEYEYRIEKTKLALKLKADGETATMIKEILRGYPSIAKLGLQRDIARSEWEAVRESINLTKWQIKITENQIQREWGRNEQV